MSDINNLEIPSQEQQGRNGQQYFSRQQLAAMFVARVHELADEWINQPETTEEDKINGVVADILELIDSGDIANGIHGHMLAAQCDEVFPNEDEEVLPFPIAKHGADFAGQLASMYSDIDMWALGTELSEQYTNNLGEYLARFGTTLIDTNQGDEPPVDGQVL